MAAPAQASYRKLRKDLDAEYKSLPKALRTDVERCAGRLKKHLEKLWQHGRRRSEAAKFPERKLPQVTTVLELTWQVSQLELEKT